MDLEAIMKKARDEKQAIAQNQQSKHQKGNDGKPVVKTPAPQQQSQAKPATPQQNQQKPAQPHQQGHNDKKDKKKRNKKNKKNKNKK